MALIEKEGNKARIGTDSVGFDFWYRSLTTAEYGRLKGDALWNEGNPARIDFIELASLAVTKIDGLPNPHEDIHTIAEFLKISIDSENENGSFIADSAWAMGWKIWCDINGVNKKKSLVDFTPQDKDTTKTARTRLSRLFKGSH
jgi:hypothetical protein